MLNQLTNYFLNLKRTSILLWRCGRFTLAILLAISVINAVIPAVTIMINTKIINIIAYQDINSKAIQHISILGVVYVLIILLERISNPASQILQGILTDRFTAEINLQLMYKANSFIGIRPFEDPTIRDLMQYVQSEASWRPMNLITFGSNVIRYGIIVISMFSLLINISPIIFLLIFLTSIPQLIAEYRFSRVTMDLTMAQSPDWRKMLYYQNVVMGEGSAKELRIWGIGDYFIKLYNETFKQIQGGLIKIRLNRLRSTIIYSIISGIGMGGAFIYIVWLAMQHKLLIGEVTLFIQAIIQVQVNIMTVFGSSALFLECMVWFEKLFQVLDIKDEMAANRTKPISSGINKTCVKISLQEVGFNYPNSEKTVLKEITVDIEPGEFVAIVGENGAGKTSLVKLLTRMYDSTTGKILIDGIEIGDYSPESLRSMFAVVFQDFNRFQLTLRENIAFGDIRKNSEFVAIKEAAKKAFVTEFSSDLPFGYQTVLGTQFEGGVDLSGGQWQRVALARAFIRDAEILILDEPTSALDVRAEAEFHYQIRELAKGKTTLVISHRFSTVRMADKIIVLDGGVIREIGNHSDLMEKNGLYASMYQMQASQYEH